MFLADWRFMNGDAIPLWVSVSSFQTKLLKQLPHKSLHPVGGCKSWVRAAKQAAFYLKVNIFFDFFFGKRTVPKLS
jgi:hypothetical protein